jgi:DNA-binding transcriptional LysR family regulator
MLEDALGLPLLTRGAQGAEPTSEGQRLAEGLSTAFGLIQSSVERLKPGPLTLSCSESIMMYWLIPRLARFKDNNPDVELRFNMSHGPVDFVPRQHQRGDSTVIDRAAQGCSADRRRT